MSNTPFLTIFPSCGTFRCLQGASVIEVLVKEKERSLEITADFPEAPSVEELTQIQNIIIEEYGLLSVRIHLAAQEDHAAEQPAPAPVPAAPAETASPEPVNVTPCHVYGSWLWHMVL